jgi:hypothetical protein
MKFKESNSELHVRCESDNTMQKEIVDPYDIVCHDTTRHDNLYL